ncbi:hypothetical protein TNCV_3305411 [Trichonephila clavipes]|nr:hypothetical protein TNCV_3305411 [Trichonephila clavipes]
MSAESPIAHRTRGAGSYEEAAITGLCKICAARLPSMEDLWAHLRDGHPNDHVKRAKAMEAFPIAFQLDRLADCLPIDTLRSTPTLHSPLRPAPHMEARELWNRPESMPRRTSPPELEPTTHGGVDGGWARQPAAAGSECGTEQISVNTDRRRWRASASLHDGAPGRPAQPQYAPDTGSTVAQWRGTTMTPLAPTGKLKTKSPVDPPGTPRNSPSQSPPREQSSPSVLDIILQDDVAANGANRTATCANKTAANANRTATCANKTAANANRTAANANRTAANVSKTTFRAILRRCDICQKRCYTEKGLSSHRASFLRKKKSSDRREQDASAVNHEDVAASKIKNDNHVKGTHQVVRNTYCRHCDKKIFLTYTLEDHYRRKHSRRLSPQGKPLSKDKPEPPKKTGSNGPPAVQPSTSKRAQGLEPIPPLMNSIPPAVWMRLPRSPHLNAQLRRDTLPSPDPDPARTAKTERRKEKKFICDFCERRFATARDLDDHARSVHEVVPEMTFAFEDEGVSE